MFVQGNWPKNVAIILAFCVVGACSSENAEPEVIVEETAVNSYRIAASNLDPDKPYVTALCAPGSSMGFIAKEVCDPATSVSVTSDSKGNFHTKIAGRKTVKDGNGQDHQCVKSDPCRVGIFDDSGILFFIHDAVWTDS